MSFTITILNVVPRVSEQDIQRKYMYRYFASKANQINQEVFEITRGDYETFLDVPYVITGHIKWLIKGKLEDTVLQLYTGHPGNPAGLEPIVVPGVLTQNKASVMFLSKKLPILGRILTNYQQFYVED